MFVHTPFPVHPVKTIALSKASKLTFACIKKNEFRQAHQQDTVLFGSLPGKPQSVNMPLTPANPGQGVNTPIQGGNTPAPQQEANPANDSNPALPPAVNSAEPNPADG
jgi:hypothetical protein